MHVLRPAVTRLGVAVTLFVVSVAIAGCGVTSVSGPREWGMSSTSADGTTHDVTVTDTSGRITNVEFDPPGVQNPGVITNPDGRLDTLLVPWAGGACDVRTAIEFSAAGQGLAGTIATKTSGQVCNMMAVQHMLRLTLNTPTPAASVTFAPAAAPAG